MSRAITGITGGKPATFQDYRKLFLTLMRPAKFSAREAGFKRPAGGLPRCEGCTHWFVNPASKHSVCEVVRLAGEDNIRATDTCKFQNEDGRTYPLLFVLS